MAPMDINLDKILCAVDFSKFSKATIDYAIGLAQGLGAHVTIFHSLSFPRTPLQGESDCRPGTAVPEQAAKAVSRIEEMMPDRPGPWETVVRCGDPVDAIVDYTEANDIGLVLAASYGLSGWKRFLMGTVIEALSRTLRRPLLVVRPSRRRGAVNPGPGPLRLKNILLCCDLSSTTLMLYPYAEKFSRHFGAKMHIVHAMSTPVQEDLVDPTTAPYAEVQHNLQTQLHARLRNRMPKRFRQNSAFTTAVIPGNPSDSLQDYASVHAIDLIIVGVRPRGSFQKILIGSTTETMIRHAPCDVLTIPCKAAED